MNTMPRRTFGWIQNPGKLENLKKVVGIFSQTSESYRFLIDERLPILLKNGLVSQSDYDLWRSYLERDTIVIPYSVLKGKGNSKDRSSALCNGLVQAVIDAQCFRKIKNLNGKDVKVKKPYTDDWTADGFLRWGISTGLLAYNVDEDSVYITDLGTELINTRTDSIEEKQVFHAALMAYPPVQRVLSILSDDKTNDGLTKFEIGSQLGFIGEMGFTSINQGYYLALLSQEENSSSIRNNIEGDSDKYARMIANWLIKMGWVKSNKKTAFGYYRGTLYEDEMNAYQITASGEAALTCARGNSSNKRIPKIVQFEMLATKAPNAGYLRVRRASILHGLRRSSTIEELISYLQQNGLTENESTLLDDITGLRNIGLDIVGPDENGKFSLNESIKGLILPAQKEEKEEITSLKDRIREQLKELSHDYLILIDLAYSDATITTTKNKDARDFEIKTIDLFTKELSFRGERMGEANKPDSVIWKNENGVIIDNKSYKDGCNIGRLNEDELSRYIEQAQIKQPEQPANEWWKIFVQNEVSQLYFLFVTSFLKGKFVENLTSLSGRRGISGAAIGVEHLLYLAEKIKRGDLLEDDFFSLFQNNEIRITL